MTLRAATPADADAIHALHRDFFNEEGYRVDDAVALRALRELIANPQYGRVVVFEDDGAAAGYLVLGFGYSLEFGGRDAFVDELYVAPSHRGRGFGTRALALAETLCREAGIQALHLEVELGNDEARKLYARFGYEEHSRFLMTKRF